MIPRADILEWRQTHPWQDDAQVEQDLLLSRVLIEIFSNDSLSEALAFRGGTALHKLYLEPPKRYSEDIDLVQINAGPIGPIYDGIQGVLNSWLGKPSRKQGPGVAKLIYRLESTGPAVKRLRLKVEINTREHFTVGGFVYPEFTVSSRWCAARCQVTTYTLEELLGTKMRALFQRRKGRDLFDLWLGLTEAKADPEKVVAAFNGYMAYDEKHVGQAEFLDNLAAKLEHPGFLTDIEALIVPGVDFEAEEAMRVVEDSLATRLA